MALSSCDARRPSALRYDSRQTPSSGKPREESMVRAPIVLEHVKPKAVARR